MVLTSTVTIHGRLCSYRGNDSSYDRIRQGEPITDAEVLKERRGCFAPARPSGHRERPPAVMAVGIDCVDSELSGCGLHLGQSSDESAAQT